MTEQVFEFLACLNGFFMDLCTCETKFTYQYWNGVANFDNMFSLKSEKFSFCHTKFKGETEEP